MSGVEWSATLGVQIFLTITLNKYSYLARRGDCDGSIAAVTSDRHPAAHVLGEDALATWHAQNAAEKRHAVLWLAGRLTASRRGVLAFLGVAALAPLILIAV